MSRQALSVPAAHALDAGLLHGSILDFGCGRGDDVNALTSRGYSVTGWDPHYRPIPAPAPADVVTMTYVLNTIEDPTERAETLSSAWALTRRTLIVSVRTHVEQRKVRGTPLADGIETSRQTFQRLFEPRELHDCLERLGGAHILLAGPGIGFAFRQRTDLLEYLARRYASSRAVPSPEAVTSAADVLEHASVWLLARGRLPTEHEADAWTAAAREHFGTLGAVSSAAQRLVHTDELAARQARLRDDATLLLALDTFHGRTATQALPQELVADARATFPSVRAARQRSDQLLRFLASPDWLDKAVRQARIGKLTGAARYVHASCVHELSLPLRLYAASAELVAGRPDFTTLIKLHHGRPAVSFLGYPDFERDPHPRLAEAMSVDLRKQAATYTDYTTRESRPLLHRKEEFLTPDHPNAEKYRRLTRQEVRAGLYDEPERIGTESGWSTALRSRGLALRGHRLVRALDS